MNKGQIQIGVLTIIGMFFSAAIGISWQAFSRSDKAVSEVTVVKEQLSSEISEVKINISEIKTDVRWIREALTGERKVGGFTSSSINGHR